MTAAAGSFSRWLWGPYSALALKIAVVTFVVDQAHKWWMLLIYRIEEKGRVTITSFFDLVFVKNTGISYSMLDGSSSSWQLVLALFSVIASAALWAWLAGAGTGRLMAWALGLIIGGALGNGLDRVLIGGVADFFSLHAYGFYWYVFNIADVAIVAGVVLLLYDSFVGSRNDAANSG
ncbi:signal peptidase II [Hyphomicrobium sp. LHD-15]|uniref:signal peptidase II n=1 Tax=Hyphomicrobium sp. LHD-15 TaxID=3072142 RepID=UPI00280FBEAE|nr:signal peptidase II [Hyphomicrobium sp. LHD-15]MDQ8698021.1 signal peptidase II [Hyphomicrobium sp. LHD-15]